jgi:putative ABC transport system permease protein
MRSFFAHKGRMVLSGLAIALSVAFVCGTLVFTDTMNATFTKFFSASVSDVRVQAAEDDRAQHTGRGPVLPVSVVDEVLRADGVAAATGRVSAEGVTVVDASGENLSAAAGGPTFGTDWGAHGARGMELVSGHAPRGAGEAVLDADTAARGAVAVGDTLTLHTLSGTFDVRVSGLAAFEATNPGAAYVLLAEATAGERLLGDPELISWVEVDAAAGVSDEQLKASVAAALGDGFEVTTKAEQEKSLAEELGGALDVIRYAMLGFAGIAVLVGIFLIVNTFSMLVAQRTREIGLLRAIGAGRRQVNRSVLLEALLLGVLGSLLGIAASVGLGRRADAAVDRHGPEAGHLRADAGGHHARGGPAGGGGDHAGRRVPAGAPGTRDPGGRGLRRQRYADDDHGEPRLLHHPHRAGRAAAAGRGVTDPPANMAAAMTLTAAMRFRNMCPRW